MRVISWVVTGMTLMLPCEAPIEITLEYQPEEAEEGERFAEMVERENGEEEDEGMDEVLTVGNTFGQAPLQCVQRLHVVHATAFPGGG